MAYKNLLFPYSQPPTNEKTVSSKLTRVSRLTGQQQDRKASLVKYTEKLHQVEVPNMPWSIIA